jgi:hypothetical protein
MNKQYHLFLDDERFPKDVVWVELPLVAWVIVRNYKQFVDTINRDGLPLSISFDHDLADEHYQEYHASRDPKLINGGNFRYDKVKEKTGYHCAQWLAQYCVDKNLPIPVYYLHTMNPIGKENMRSVLETARKCITPQHKCTKCGTGVDSAELHSCPYQEEINGNDSAGCDCCPACSRQCAEDI